MILQEKCTINDFTREMHNPIEMYYKKRKNVIIIGQELRLTL